MSLDDWVEYQNDFAVVENEVKFDLLVNPAVETLALPVSLPCSNSGEFVKYEIKIISGVQNKSFISISGPPSSVSLHPSKVEMEGKDYYKTEVEIKATSALKSILFTLNINFFLCSE